MTQAEALHIERVKAMPCAVCKAAGPSDFHHILTGRTPSRKSPTYTGIPLCKSCHQDGHNGIHGQGRMWSVMKATELECLSNTIAAILREAR